MHMNSLQQEHELSTTAGTCIFSLQQEHDLSTTEGTWNMHLISIKQEHDLSTTKGTWNMCLIAFSRNMISVQLKEHVTCI
jgi:hypothetical protein